eukprot:gnl/MRDRNA2_/MRDRNA2_61156_c0_seq1.p1 gnl/MRDRNA2_/MRDRNA2_61156_c0~~gnl/MRDRNA2_/MRDRNA2_61156_c0_seq1.p1  ORF type:complete len:1487 (+),score=407.19 gnl/MRDRNA2_/MRDRNA2_61156_c0_seq1:162-4622(+)
MWLLVAIAISINTRSVTASVRGALLQIEEQLQTSDSNGALRKVVELLEDMREESISKQKKELELQKAKEEECVTDIAQLQADLDGHVTDVDSLSAQTASLEDDISRLGHDIEESESEQRSVEDTLAVRTKENQNEVNGDMDEIAGFNAALNAVEKASSVMPKTSLLQKRRFIRAQHGGANPSDNDDLSLDSASSSVANTLESLTKLFSQKRDLLLDTVGESKHNFQKEKKALQTIIKEASESQESQKGEQAGKEETLATASADLRKSKSSATEVETLLNATEKSCAEEESAALARNALRQQEIEAVTDALGFLKKALPNATQNETSLLQARHGIQELKQTLGTHGTSPGFPPTDSQKKLLGFLRREASQLKSRALGRLLVRATQAMQSRESGADVFDMVKSMIEQLIEQLLQEQGEGLQQKAFCDEELAKNKHTHTTAEREIQEASAEVGQLEASMAHLEGQLTEASEERAALQSELLTRAEARANSSAAHADEAEDAEAAASAIKAAQEVLKEHQANVSKANDGKPTGMDGVGTVVAMLDHVEEQYSAVGADAKKAEATEAESHTLWTREAKSTIATLTTEVKYKNDTFVELNASLASAKEELNVSTQKLQGAISAHEQLVPACLEESPSYEERKREREEEIDALRKALEIIPKDPMEDEVSLLAVSADPLQKLTSGEFSRVCQLTKSALATHGFQIDTAKVSLASPVYMQCMDALESILQVHMSKTNAVDVMDGCRSVIQRLQKGEPCTLKKHAVSGSNHVVSNGLKRQEHAAKSTSSSITHVRIPHNATHEVGHGLAAGMQRNQSHLRALASDNADHHTLHLSKPFKAHSTKRKEKKQQWRKYLPHSGVAHSEQPLHSKLSAGSKQISKDMSNEVRKSHSWHHRHDVTSGFSSVDPHKTFVTHDLSPKKMVDDVKLRLRHHDLVAGGFGLTDSSMRHAATNMHGLMPTEDGKQVEQKLVTQAHQDQVKSAKALKPDLAADLRHDWAAGARAQDSAVPGAMSGHLLSHKAAKEEDEEKPKTPPPSGSGKAVELLKDMRADIKDEIDEDKEAHENVTQWCDSTIAITSSAVKAAYARDGDLLSKVTVAASKNAKMEVELEELGKSVADASKSLQEAEAIRKSQRETFTSNEKSLLQSIRGLKIALRTLGNKGKELDVSPDEQDAALTESAPGALVAARAAVEQAVKQLEAHPIPGVQPPSEDQMHLLSMVGTSASVAPSDSSQVVGMLKTMLDSFQSDLQRLRRDEEQEQMRYGRVTPPLKDSAKLGQKEIETKTSAVADQTERLSAAKTELDDLRKARASDEKYLETTVSECRSAKLDFQDRNRTRHEDLAAIEKALDTLQKSNSASDDPPAEPAAALLQVKNTFSIISLVPLPGLGRQKRSTALSSLLQLKPMLPPLTSPSGSLQSSLNMPLIGRHWHQQSHHRPQKHCRQMLLPLLVRNLHLSEASFLRNRIEKLRRWPPVNENLLLRRRRCRRSKGSWARL